MTIEELTKRNEQLKIANENYAKAIVEKDKVNADLKGQLSQMQKESEAEKAKFEKQTIINLSYSQHAKKTNNPFSDEIVENAVKGRLLNDYQVFADGTIKSSDGGEAFDLETISKYEDIGHAIRDLQKLYSNTSEGKEEKKTLVSDPANLKGNAKEMYERIQKSRR